MRVKKLRQESPGKAPYWQEFEYEKKPDQTVDRSIIYENLQKSNAFIDVCPMKIPTLASMAKLNRK